MRLFDLIREAAEMITDDRAEPYSWQRDELERTRSQWQRLIPAGNAHGMAPHVYRIRGYENRYAIYGECFEIEGDTVFPVKSVKW